MSSTQSSSQTDDAAYDAYVVAEKRRKLEREKARRTMKNMMRWKKLVKSCVKAKIKEPLLQKEIYGERRFAMVVYRNLMVEGRAALRDDIARGAENAKNILVKGIMGLHPEHKENVGISLLFRRRLPNRAFTKITRFLDQKPRKSIAQLKRDFEEGRDKGEGKKLWKNLMSAGGTIQGVRGDMCRVWWDIK